MPGFCFPHSNCLALSHWHSSLVIIRAGTVPPHSTVFVLLGLKDVSKRTNEWFSRIQLVTQGRQRREIRYRCSNIPESGDHFESDLMVPSLLSAWKTCASWLTRRKAKSSVPSRCSNGLFENAPGDRLRKT